MDKATIESIEQAVQKAFSAEGGDKRFIDITRIPLICQSIIGINDSLKAIESKLDNKFVTKESFSPVQKIVYGLVGLILTAVTIAILGLVTMKP